MVLIVAGHANYLVYEPPSKIDMLSSPSISLFRIILYQLGVVAVNCFVFISGWFKIKPDLKKGGYLILETLEYGFGISLLFLLLHYHVPKQQFIRMFFVGEYYWFIIAYLQLLLVAPILNYFVENTSKGMFRTVVVLFILFEFVYGWIGGVGNYASGYSGLHFIGVYLLAQYIRQFLSSDISYLKSFSLYLIPALLSVGLIWIGGGIFNEKWTYTLFRYMISYNSPLVLLSSVGLFLVFYRIKFRNKIVNWMSSSVLAIYLIHLQPQFFENVFTPLILRCEMNVILIVGIVIATCFFCIMADKIRLYIEHTLIKLFSLIHERKNLHVV